jgi:hypothetical protein
MKLVVALLASGCAQASLGGGDAAPPGSDGNHPHPDAHGAPDAGRDAAIDAACVPHASELLMNPAFDANPLGTGWTEQNIDNAYPVITADMGLNPQTPPNRAWMGGIAGMDENKVSVTDVLYQDVAVPAGTTQLVLTMWYAVATAETDPGIYDQASVGLVKTDGTSIESILAVDNTSPATAWTQLSHTVTANVVGQTVRLRFTSTNDITNPTSFYFDTVSLQATHCP